MASPMRAVAEVLSQLMHPNRAADIIRMADADPAFAAKLMEAVQADDFGRSLRMLVADAQWGAAPARPAPVRPEAPAALTTAQRMMRDPNIRPAIDANLDRLPPELAERIAADDPDAFMEAFQMIAEAEGELPLRGPDPFANIAPDDGVGMPPELAAMTDDQQAAFVADMMQAPPPATRQMELPLTADVPTSFSAQSIGPIPTGPDFVTTAGPLPGGMDALLQRLNAIDGLGSKAASPALRVVPRSLAAGLAPSSRSQNLGRSVAAGAAGAGIGALVNQMMQGRNTDMSPELLGDLDDSAMPVNMEELPAAQPDLVMEPPVDYSLEARKLIDQLNAMRRQAGGEVPEAGKMQSEIQRLMDLGNKTRRATYAAAPQDESSQMFQQAQGMIDQVNDLYRQGHSQGSPQVRQIMQEVRRLQQAGDAIRNRRSA